MVHVCGILELPVPYDANYIFKFRIGDKVKKRWRWKSDITRNISHSRFFSSDVPLGSIGTVHKIFPISGVICVRFNGDEYYHFGASELDVLPKPEKPKMRKAVCYGCGRNVAINPSSSSGIRIHKNKSGEICGSSGSEVEVP